MKKILRIAMKKLVVKKILNEDYNQGNAHGNDDAMHGHVMERKNSNIVGRR